MCTVKQGTEEKLKVDINFYDCFSQNELLQELGDIFCVCLLYHCFGHLAIF